MAIIWFEHYELYGTSLNEMLLRGYNLFNAVASSSISTLARTGSRCFRSSSSTINNGVFRQITPTSTVGQGCAFLLESTPTTTRPDAGGGLRFGTVANPSLIRVNFNSSFGVSVFQNTTLLGSSSAINLYTANSWFWVEAKVTAGAGSTGSVEVRVNNNQVLLLTGLTLTDNWNAVGNFMIDASNSSAQPVFRADDWIVWDTTGDLNNDFMGDTFVIVASPTADAAPDQWVASTGNDGWAMINETTPNDSTFIRANNVGDASEFTHASLNLPVGAVAAIGVQTRAYKTDAGASSIQVGLASGSATSMSPEIALATGPTYQAHISNLNPDGNVPWTQGAAQAARLRVQRNA